MDAITEKIDESCREFNAIVEKFEAQKNIISQMQIEYKEAEKRFSLMKSMDELKVSALFTIQ